MRLNPTVGLVSVLLAAPLHAVEPPAGSFPCDQASLPHRPKLVFLAEDHKDALSIKVKKAAEEGAAQGRYYLGLEVIKQEYLGYAGPLEELDQELGASKDTARIFGLEGSPGTAFALLWVYTSKHNVVGWGEKDGPYMFGAIGRMPGLKDAFVAAAGSGALDARTAFLVRAAAGQPAAGDDAQAAPFSDAGDNERMHQAAVQARTAAARLIYRKEPEAWVGSILSHLEPDADTSSIELAFMVPIRNRDFARELAKLYCAAGAEGKDLVAAVGYEHEPGLEEILKSWSATPLDIKAFNTRDFDEADDARELLRSWSRGGSGSGR